MEYFGRDNRKTILDKMSNPHVGEEIKIAVKNVANINDIQKSLDDLIDLRKGRCWEGYKPTPGKKAYSDGSCVKKGEDSDDLIKKGEDGGKDKKPFPGTKASDVEGTGMKWITVNGRKILIDGEGSVQAGGGGMADGKDIEKVSKKEGATGARKANESGGSIDNLPQEQKDNIKNHILKMSSSFTSSADYEDLDEDSRHYGKIYNEDANTWQRKGDFVIDMMAQGNSGAGENPLDGMAKEYGFSDTYEMGEALQDKDPDFLKELGEAVYRKVTGGGRR